MEEKGGDVKLSFGGIKKNWTLIVLILILFIGFYFRVYHVDYPVVGYHNWKETHYLTEARNFAEDGFFENGIFTPYRDYSEKSDNFSGTHTDSFPSTSIIVGFLFSIFGSSLFLARLTNILLTLGSIVLVYSIFSLLFKRKNFALITAVIFAINPLSIFFGRQVQLINAALFFCLLGVYFYIKWHKNGTAKNAFWFSFFLLLGILTKYSFILFAIPILFTYPYRRIKEKKYFKQHATMAVLVILSFSWIKYISSISHSIAQQASFLDIGPAFTSAFWQTMIAYMKDNYTVLGVFLFLLGIFFWFFVVKVNKKSLGYKFMNAYFFGAVVWFFLMSGKLAGHNYHQYPLIPLFVFFTAFFVYSISNIVAKMVGVRKAKWFFVLIILVILLIPSMQSKDRMFDTQFIGLDIAGDYVREHSSPDEKMIHSGHQDYGFIWHADREAVYDGVPSTEDIIEAEEELNVRWIFLYQWGLNVMNEPQWEYISQHYSLKQMAVTQSGGTATPFYFLLEKGGSFDLEALTATPPKTRTYEYSAGTRELLYFEI